LRLTAATLRLRRERPASFRAAFTPLPGDDGLLGYLRGDDVVVLGTRLPDASGRVPDAEVELPEGTWTDGFTGVSHVGRVESGDLLRELPVALLVRDETH